MSFKNFGIIVLLVSAVNFAGAFAWAGDDASATVGQNNDPQCSQVYDKGKAVHGDSSGTKQKTDSTQTTSGSGQ